MITSPRKVLYLAISNYLTPEKAEAFYEEVWKKHPLSDNAFLKIAGKYFDFNDFKNKPYIKEDIWLFNYLMYQLKHKDDFNPLWAGEKISLKGRLPKIGLIAG